MLGRLEWKEGVNKLEQKNYNHHKGNRKKQNTERKFLEANGVYHQEKKKKGLRSTHWE